MSATGERDRFTYAGIFAVAIAAAVLSFSSLTGLARMAGVTSSWAGFRLAWLLPIAVDAYAVTATRVWLAGGSNPATVRYARANAVGAIGLSVAGNATYHALTAAGIRTLGDARAGWVLVVAVSAVPPVMLGLVGHLHALISASHEEVGSGAGGPSSDTRGDAGSEERPAPVSTPEPTGPATTIPTTDPVPQTPAHPAPAKPATVRRSRSTGKTSTGTGASPAEAVMRKHWATERAAGRTPTGAELDRVAGTKDYGRRIRRTLLAEDEAATAAETPAEAPTASEPSTDPTDSADRDDGAEPAAA